MNPFRILFVLTLLFGSCVKAQEVPDSEVVHPYQRVTVPNLSFITAKDSNAPAVAKAAIAIVLSSSKIRCNPTSELETVVEADAASPLSKLISKIADTSCSMDGHTQRVSSLFTPNGAIKANDLIASIMQSRPLLMQWKGSLYVLYGVTYDQHLHYSGTQDNVVREFLLIDPRYSDNRRLIVFERGRDNFAEVEGVASVSVAQ